jgi:putative intracellular protease/amidase
MATSLNGKTIAFLVAPEGVERVERSEPWKAIERARGTPELVSTEVGKNFFDAGVATDLRNAGANWVDDEVVECSRGPNTLASSRKPDDLPAFCNALVGAFAKDKS